MAVFPQLLRQVREAAGLSQNALGRRIDINPGTINRLETGEREPTGREQVLQLAGGIGLDATQTIPDALFLVVRHHDARPNIGGTLQ